MPPHCTAQGSEGSHLAWRLAGFSLRWVLAAPFRLGMWYLALALCCVTWVLVGLLLHRQVRSRKGGQLALGWLGAGH